MQLFLWMIVAECLQYMLLLKLLKMAYKSVINNIVQRVKNAWVSGKQWIMRVYIYTCIYIWYTFSHNTVL